MVSINNRNYQIDFHNKKKVKEKTWSKVWTTKAQKIVIFVIHFILDEKTVKMKQFW